MKLLLALRERDFARLRTLAALAVGNAGRGRHWPACCRVIVCVVLYVVAGLRRDEELHPLLGDDYAGACVSSADSGSGTPAIS